MSGGGIMTLGKLYEAVTGDDKYADAWRKPVSTLTGGEKDLPAAVKPEADPALDAKAQSEREEEIRKRIEMANRGGRASTILTSGLSKMAGGSSKKVLFGE